MKQSTITVQPSFRAIPLHTAQTNQDRLESYLIRKRIAEVCPATVFPVHIYY